MDGITTTTRPEVPDAMFFEKCALSVRFTRGGPLDGRVSIMKTELDCAVQLAWPPALARAIGRALIAQADAAEGV